MLGGYRGLKTIGHSGIDWGYRAEYLQFPDQHFALIILGNVDTLDPPGNWRGAWLMFASPANSRKARRAIRGTALPKPARWRRFQNARRPPGRALTGT